jgi:hypothetical protein
MCWLAGFDGDFARLPSFPKSLGEVGPRRACVIAEQGRAVARIRAELRRYVLNRIIGRYLKVIIDGELIVSADRGLEYPESNCQGNYKVLTQLHLLWEETILIA